MKENPYLKPTYFIDCDADSVREKSLELTRNAKKIRERAIALFTFVRDEIHYNVFSPRPSPDYFRASHVLAAGEGYCVQKAVLLVALARAAGIPSRLRFAEIKNHLASAELVAKRGSNVFAWHGLAEVCIRGTWMKVTPTYDLEYCRKAGVFPVHFDGTTDALLPPRTRDGRLHVEYLKDRGAFRDLPVDEIRKASLSRRYLSEW